MKIRKATVKDAALIAKINMEAEDPFDKILGIKETWIKNNFKNAIKKKEMDVFIYDNKGVVALKKFNGFDNGEINWLVVNKQNQKKGIGTKLIKFSENQAKKMNYRGLYLYTHPIHKVAIKLYKKLGFKKINEFPNYYSNGDKSILMGKILK